ncbi:hypothetical protein ACFFWD_07660 [Bradyrhizobium erythrophlei]|uniref:hypothetical protein n=1 Tax=Bradyrhizobium erythrophlei TaxID=1437360 RepID=UPI0035E4E608
MHQEVEAQITARTVEISCAVSVRAWHMVRHRRCGRVLRRCEATRQGSQSRFASRLTDQAYLTTK